MTKHCTHAHEVWAIFRGHFEKQVKNAKIAAVLKLKRTERIRMQDVPTGENDQRNTQTERNRKYSTSR